MSAANNSQVTEALWSLDDSLMSSSTLDMELEDLVFPVMLWVRLRFSC